MNQWGNLHLFDAFRQQWGIADEMEEKMRNMEKCVALFNVSFHVRSLSVGSTY